MSEAARQRVAYALSRSIREAPSANAYQKPIGLARAFGTVLLLPASASLPDAVAQAVTVERLQVCTRGDRVPVTRYAVFARQVSLKLRDLSASGRGVAAVCTGFGDDGALAGLAARRRLGVPWIVFAWDPPYLGQMDRRTPVARAVHSLRVAALRQAVRRCDLLVLNIHPGLCDALRIRGRSDVCLPNGVDYSYVSAYGQRYRPIAGLVGAVSVVRDAKGCWEIAAAFRRLHQKHPTLRLRLIGDCEPPTRDRLLQCLGAEVGRAVTFTGRVAHEESLRLAAECSILIHAYRDVPSLRWNYVLKLPEYMALGRAIVSTALPGAMAYIRDGLNGVLVPPSDPTALAAAIGRLAEDGALAARFAVAAQRDASQYDWRVIHDRLNTTISDVITGAQRHG